MVELFILLFIAAMNNNEVIVKLLLAARATVNVQDINGDTALILGNKSYSFFFVSLSFYYF